MSRFRNIHNEVIVSVADEKDERFGEGWELVTDVTPAKKPAAKPSAK